MHDVYQIKSSALSFTRSAHISDDWLQSVGSRFRFQPTSLTGEKQKELSTSQPRFRTKSKDLLSRSLALNQCILKSKTLAELEVIVHDRLSDFNEVNCATGFRRCVKLFTSSHRQKSRIQKPSQISCLVSILSKLKEKSRELVETFDGRDFSSIWWGMGTLVQNLTLSQLEDAVSEKDLDMFEEKTIHALTHKLGTLTAANRAQSMATFLWGKTRIDRVYLTSGAWLAC